jgi:hypothetical protein
VHAEAAEAEQRRQQHQRRQRPQQRLDDAPLRALPGPEIIILTG